MIISCKQKFGEETSRLVYDHESADKTPVPIETSRPNKPADAAGLHDDLLAKMGTEIKFDKLGSALEDAEKSALEKNINSVRVQVKNVMEGLKIALAPGNIDRAKEDMHKGIIGQLRGLVAEGLTAVNPGKNRQLTKVLGDLSKSMKADFNYAGKKVEITKIQAMEKAPDNKTNLVELYSKTIGSADTKPGGNAGEAPPQGWSLDPHVIRDPYKSTYKVGGEAGPVRTTLEITAEGERKKTSAEVEVGLPVRPGYETAGGKHYYTVNLPGLPGSSTNGKLFIDPSGRTMVELNIRMPNGTVLKPIVEATRKGDKTSVYGRVTYEINLPAGLNFGTRGELMGFQPHTGGAKGYAVHGVFTLVTQ